MKATSSFVLPPFANLWTSRLQKPDVRRKPTWTPDRNEQLERKTEFFYSNTNLQEMLWQKQLPAAKFKCRPHMPMHISDATETEMWNLPAKVRIKCNNADLCFDGLKAVSELPCQDGAPAPR